MVFNSQEFVLFLVIVFALYWGPFSKRFKIQNILIVIASYFFYGWWDWRFLSLLLFSSVIDFATAFYMQQTENVKRRKFLLAISLITNLGLLGVFKYYDFFVTSFVEAFASLGVHLNVSTLNIILPVGISFYTFQTLSYTIDVYRKHLVATKDFIAFSAFVSFFPQLVAGPIERATHLLPQFQKPRVFNEKIAITGLRLMLWGFFKKIVIADNVGTYVDIIYGSPNDFHGLAIVVGTVFFAFQIYCDFSGYSDIAIGCSRLFGFDLMQNFDTPYFATSPRSFWRRWHISLSTWFRDYLYIPLGGNRGGFVKTQFNLLLTFVISGLWHGANMTFVVWGFFHGLLLNLQNILAHKKVKIKLPKFISIIMLFSLVCFGWIFFRAKTLQEAFLLIGNITHPSSSSEWQLIFLNGKMPISLGISIVIWLGLEYGLKNENWNKQFLSLPTIIRWSFYYLMMLWVIIFGAWSVAPNFIYFQF